MTKLYLTTVRLRFRFGEKMYQSPSRFLEELPQDFMEVDRRYRAASAGHQWREHTRQLRSMTIDEEARYHSDELPDYDNSEGSAEGYQVGNIVEHEYFGKGKIL